MSKLQKTIIQIILVIIILAVSVGLAMLMMSMKKPPNTTPPVVLPPLLEGVTVAPDTIQMTVTGSGTVQPRMQVQVVPQVSGKVVECNPQLVNGGFFKANETLLEIEQTDYELAVESAAANVAQAEVTLEREKAEADVARREWERLRPGEEPDSVLVFREPQIRSAEAQLKAALAQLARAELDLKRTTIKMPFDGRVVSTNIDEGQFITAGSPIATVYRTDMVEVVIPLENSDLEWFDVPLKGNSNSDSNPFTIADVYATFAGGEYHWQGRLVRTEGQIDSRSRMVRVVTQVDDPFHTESGQPPLMPGMFVKVDIQGNKVANIVRIPRYAMRDTNKVWVAHQSEEGDDPSSSDAEPDPVVEQDSGAEQEQPIEKTLWIKTVKSVRIDKEYAYISEGLDDGDIVITSQLETVTDGMTVRILTEETGEKEAAAL